MDEERRKAGGRGRLKRSDGSIPPTAITNNLPFVTSLLTRAQHLLVDTSSTLPPSTSPLCPTSPPADPNVPTITIGSTISQFQRLNETLLYEIKGKDEEIGRQRMEIKGLKERIMLLEVRTGAGAADRRRAIRRAIQIISNLL